MRDRINEGRDNPCEQYGRTSGFWIGLISSTAIAIKFSSNLIDAMEPSVGRGLATFFTVSIDITSIIGTTCIATTCSYALFCCFLCCGASGSAGYSAVNEENDDSDGAPLRRFGADSIDLDLDNAEVDHDSSESSSVGVEVDLGSSELGANDAPLDYDSSSSSSFAC